MIQMIHAPKKAQPYSEVPSLVLDFNVQFKDIEKIIRRHWYILKEDKHLQKILPEKPLIIYKRAPTLRDIIVNNVVEPPPKNKFSFLNGKGFYPCKYCYACTHAKKKIQGKKQEFKATSTGNIYPIKDFINCYTEGVVYILQCSCNLQYVGRTIEN